jgi:hypothetical protein
MTLVVQKQKRELTVAGGGIVGNKDVIGGFRFTRKGFMWQVDHAQAENYVLLRDKQASYELDLDEGESRVKVRRRYPALEALPINGRLSWVSGDKPIHFRVSPKNVFAGRALRLVSDQPPAIPDDSESLVHVTTKGWYAATIETGGPRGPRLMDVVVRANADVDKVVKAVKDALDAYTVSPIVSELNSALSEKLKDIDLFGKKSKAPAEAPKTETVPEEPVAPTPEPEEAVAEESPAPEEPVVTEPEAEEAEVKETAEAVA